MTNKIFKNNKLINRIFAAHTYHKVFIISFDFLPGIIVNDGDLLFSTNDIKFISTYRSIITEQADRIRIQLYGNNIRIDSANNNKTGTGYYQIIGFII